MTQEVCKNISTEDFLYAQRLVQLGVAVNGVDLACSYQFPTRSRLFRASRIYLPPHVSSSRFRGQTALDFAYRFKGDTIPAIMSALQINGSVQSVSFGQCHDLSDDSSSQNLFWHWMAFALLRPESNRSVKLLTIYPKMLSTHSVIAIRDMLEAEDPFKLLFSKSRNLDRDECLQAKRFYLKNPASITQDEAVLQEDCTTTVIGKIDEYWSVLLPGYGEVWVHESDAELISERI